MGTAVASVGEWLTTTDHKRIGRLYLGAGAVGFLLAAVLAVLVGAERIATGGKLVDADALTQLFALERFGFTYLALAPLVLGAALAVVPLQLGARSLAFPRLAAAGFWLWLIGAVLAVYSIIGNGGPNGGNARFVELFILATMLVLAGLLAGAVCLTTSILTTRAPGMNMRRLPMFSWSVLVACLAALISLPVVAGDLLFTYVANRFQAAQNLLSGSQAIGEWAGFGFSQPTTLLFVIPVFGFFAETVATASGMRQPSRGVLFTGIGLIGLVSLATVVQSPITLRPAFLDLGLGDLLADLLPFGLVHGLPLLGALLAFALIVKPLSARPRNVRKQLMAPVAFGLLAALLALLAVAASAAAHIGDAALLGTTFEEGNWLAVGFAGVLAAMGAVTYWAPKWWGRSLSNATLPLALLAFLGAGLAALPLMVAGFADQPGAVFAAVGSDADAIVNFDYGGPASLWNTLSTIGLALATLSVLGFIVVAARSVATGQQVADDPWNGQTLEWVAESPAAADNFAVVHTVASAEPALDLRVSDRGAR